MKNFMKIVSMIAAGWGISASTAGAALIGTVDYSDTFTVGTTARPDGVYNDNSTGAYNVENLHGNPASTWTPFSNFSLNSGGGSTCCGYPGNTGNTGAASGLAQSGGNDYSFTYGLRNDYIVQLDAVIPSDRLDVSSFPAAGNSIFTANSLSVFFRKAGTGLPGIGIYNGSAEADTGFVTGIAAADTAWHNLAVRFNHTANSVTFFVDEVSKGTLDLTSFAGGAYQNYGNGAVGAGGAGTVHWVDNFQVGAPVPEPISACLVGVVATAWIGLVRPNRSRRQG